MAFANIDSSLYQLAILAEEKEKEEKMLQQNSIIEIRRQQIRDKKNKLALTLNTFGMIEGNDGEGSDNPALWKEDTSSMDLEINTLKLNNKDYNNLINQPIKKAKNSNTEKSFVYHKENIRNEEYNSRNQSFSYGPTYMLSNNRNIGMGNNTTTAVMTGCKRPVWC